MGCFGPETCKQSRPFKHLAVSRDRGFPVRKHLHYGKLKSGTAAGVYLHIKAFLDQHLPGWEQKLVGLAGDGATVNGCEFGDFANASEELDNVAGKLQTLMNQRGVARKLLTAWCGAHRHALVWQKAWASLPKLQTLEDVMNKAPKRDAGETCHGHSRELLHARLLCDPLPCACLRLFPSLGPPSLPADVRNSEFGTLGPPAVAQAHNHLRASPKAKKDVQFWVDKTYEEFHSWLGKGKVAQGARVQK